MKGKITRIYVDTNVLVNYCTSQQADIIALKYIFSKRRKEVLFTSALAVVQAITHLQSDSKQYDRKAYSREITLSKLNEILPKFTFLDLSFSDVKNAFSYLNRDVEDSVHYVLSQKKNCDAILTNNIKDFARFDIPVLKPDLGILKSKIQ
jgi:predicted nucleic acid-binding protein